MPVTKQSIAFIGATGAISSALARGTARGNYRLLLFDRTSDEIKSLAKDIRHNTPNADISIMDCAHKCSWEADVIMLDVSENELDNVLPNIRDVATQKIVVQLPGNPKERVGTTTDITEKLHDKLPYSKIIRLWTTEPFTGAKNSTASDALFISGDDNEALQTVSEIIETAGLQPVVKDTINE